MRLHPARLLLLLAFGAVCAFNPLQMGPFKILVRYIEKCPDSGTEEMIVTARIKKFNKTTPAADFNLTLKVPYDDRLSIKYTLAQMTNGGFKQNFFTHLFPKACGTLENLVPGMFKDLLKGLKVSSCPIQKGFYEVKDFTTDAGMKNVTVFFYNKFKATVGFVKKSKLIGCFNAVVDVVPKKKNRL